VEAAGFAVQIAHCANSAALLLYPASRMNLVRPGLLIYGILPPVPDDTPRPALRPALSLKSRIVLIRDMPQGYTVGYGRTHTLRRSSRIATIPVGYGDGYPRALSNCGEMLVCGRRAPIVGRVNMDVTLVDVTDIPRADIGSAVVLIGTQDEERITAEEIARRIGTTEHDVTTRLTPRVPRKYISQGAAE
jgi:alanine racemase